MSDIFFIGLFIVTAILDVIVAVAVLRSSDRGAHALGWALIAGAAVALFYLGSVYAGNHLIISVLSSCYFSSVSIALVTFCAYITHLVKPHTRPVHGLFLFFRIYLLVDIIGLMLSPFMGDFALTYIEMSPGSGLYSYDAHPWYWCHLLYCYLMVAYCVVLLIYKSVKSPGIYQTRYVTLLAGFLFIILLNAAYLFLPDTKFYDYSIIFYSLLGLYIFIMQFYYLPRTLLNNARSLVLNQLGHAVILFDHEDHFITLNPPAEFLVPEDKRNSSLLLDKFIDDIGIRSHVLDTSAETNFYWSYVHHGKRSSYRVNYRILKDHKGYKVGSLFVISDNSLEVDILTGFINNDAAARTIARDAATYEHPCTLIACDIERLSYINETYGRDVGDDSLALLANIMRVVCPDNSYFVRFSDATLMAILPGTSEQGGHNYANEISARIAAQTTCPAQLVVQSCVELFATDENIMTAVRRTMGGLRSRKLLMENSSHASLISSLAQMQRQGDGETEDHVQRTRTTGELLGRRLGLSDSQLNDFALLCLLHDIGKVGVPLEVLNKPGRLTGAEWNVMKSHTTKGYTIAMASDELHGIAEFILHHHENWNGSGYPDGLSGEAIPLLSRMVSVVDTFDAMTHNRPYRLAIPLEDAKAELKRCAGSQFDPTIVAEFLSLLEEHPELAESEWKPSPSDIAAGAPGANVAEVQLASHKAHGTTPAGATPGDISCFEESDGKESRLFVQEYAHYHLDDQGNILEINEEFTRMTGYTTEDLETYHLNQRDLIPPEDQEAYWANVGAGLKKDHAVMMEHRIRTKSGIDLNVMCYGREYFDPVNKTGRSEIIAADLQHTDMAHNLLAEARTKSDRAQQRWEDALRRDGTGVLTRPAFRTDVQLLLMDETKTVLLMMVDVDNFKQYNDTKGHPQGDALLNRMAQLLMEAEGDKGFAGRFGGDEFAVARVFDRGVSRTRLEEAAAWTWQHVNDGLMAYDGVHISLGASCEMAGDITFSSLYAHTDDALYAAKEAGRACYRTRF